jgi:hypothetical protein
MTHGRTLALIFRAEQGHSERMKWEYLTVKFATSGWFLGGILDGQKFNDRLNQLGAQGWELVSVFDTNMAEGQTRDVVAVLKRPST